MRRRKVTTTTWRTSLATTQDQPTLSHRSDSVKIVFYRMCERKLECKSVVFVTYFILQIQPFCQIINPAYMDQTFTRIFRRLAVFGQKYGPYLYLRILDFKIFHTAPTFSGPSDLPTTFFRARPHQILIGVKIIPVLDPYPIIKPSTILYFIIISSVITFLTVKYS